MQTSLATQCRYSHEIRVGSLTFSSFGERIVDVHDSYGPTLIRKLAESPEIILGRPAAMLNADNYQWFAMVDNFAPNFQAISNALTGKVHPR